MPKYTEKDQATLAWNRIRRSAEAMIRLAGSHWVEEKKNEILPDLQAEFEDALQRGVILELEPALNDIQILLDEARVAAAA